MRLKFRNYKTVMTSSIRHYHKGSLESENKLSTGRVSIMIWKDNMLIYRVSLKKRKLFGRANLSSLKSKKSRLRRTMKMLLSNSRQLSTSFKSLRTKTSRSMSTTT